MAFSGGFILCLINLVQLQMHAQTRADARMMMMMMMMMMMKKPTLRKARMLFMIQFCTYSTTLSSSTCGRACVVL